MTELLDRIRDGLIYLQARDRNVDDDATSYLHCDEAVYVQHIEGPATAVLPLFHRIEANARHSDVETLQWGITRERRFPSWGMAFSNDETASYLEFRRSGFFSEEISRAMEQDLLTFMDAIAEREPLLPAA